MLITLLGQYYINWRWWYQFLVRVLKILNHLKMS